jgi:hypothetical protein
VLGSLAQHLVERAAHDVVDLGQAEHEMLDQHPVADADAPERHGPAAGPDLAAMELEEGERGEVIRSIGHARTSGSGSTWLHRGVPTESRSARATRARM